jgi:hypothetical protein
VRGVLKDHHLEHVRVVQGFRVEYARAARVLLEWQHAHEAFPRVVLLEYRVQIGSGHRFGQRLKVQRNLHQHPLREIPDGGREHGRARQVRVLLNLGQMLVIQVQGVSAVRAVQVMLTATFKGVNQLATAAAVAARALNRQHLISSHQARVHQGPQERNRARGVAPDVRHEPGVADGFGLVRRQFRESVDPARCDPVRGAGVQHAHVRVLEPRHGFFSSLVRQAQHDQINAVQQAFALGFILAFGVVNADQFQVVASLQAGTNLQAGRSGFTINENLGSHAGHCTRI